jgi:hypothetical protein
MPALPNSTDAANEERLESAQRARRWAIVFAVIAVLAFVVHVVLNDWLTKLDNSITAAQVAFSKRLDDDALRADIDRLQKEMTTAGGPGVAAGRNLEAATEQMQRQSADTCAHLQGDFDGVATLIDALPRKPDVLLDQLASTRAVVQKAEGDASGQLATRTQFRGDSHPLAEAVSAGLTCTIRMFDVTPLQQTASRAANDEKATIESLLRFCNRTTYAAGIIALILAIYAGFKGLKPRPA